MSAARSVVGAAAPEPFGDRLSRHVRAGRSQLVLGLDPDPQRLWPRALELEAASDRSTEPALGHWGDTALATRHDPALRAARAVAIHCALAIEAVAAECVAVKLQLACFERLGAAGHTALSEVSAQARRHGLLVIADAKRGDIDVTASAYAQAFFSSTATPFGSIAGLGSDALTVNPLLGLDSLAPLTAAARDHDAGLFVLVRTTNPGAADVQEQPLAGGGTVSERLAELVAQAGGPGVGQSGLSDVGAVVAATAPERIGRLRALMPSAVFLLPGIGAQGGQLEGLGPAFEPGPAGGLVTVSRGLVFAYERQGGQPAQAAARAARRLRERAWQLSGWS